MEINKTNKDVTDKKLYFISNLLYILVIKVPPRPETIYANGNVSGPTIFTNKAEMYDI